MKSKQYMYAAVGAPVAVAKVAQHRVEEFRVKLTEGRESLTKDLQKQLEDWASEGEHLVGKIGESKTIDEITERVDLDQVQEQVSKLRDQLEDLLDTWRTNFRPAGKTEKVADKVEKITVKVVETAADTIEPVAKKPAAKVTAVKTTSVKTPAAKTPAAKTPAAKTTAAKTTAAKKPAAKKPAAKKPAAKKPAAKATATEASSRTAAPKSEATKAS